MPTSTAHAASLVVQLLAPLPPSEEQALLDACALAHQHGPCITAEHASPDDTLEGVVEFTSETHVLIELNDSHPWRSLYASRQLVFGHDDAPKERAKAIGLALGVLATSLTQGRVQEDQEDEDEDVSEPEADPQPGPDSPPPDEQRKAPPLSARFELMAAAGVEFSPSWPAAGPAGALAGRFFPTAQLGWSAEGQVAALVTPSSDPSLTALSLATGPSLRFERKRWATWIDLQGGAAWIQARIDTTQAQTPVGTRVTPLIRIKWSNGIRVGEALWLTITPQASFHLTPTRVFVDDNNIGHLKTGLIGGQLGVVWTPR